jgi:hypothetical protein
MPTASPEMYGAQSARQGYAGQPGLGKIQNPSAVVPPTGRDAKKVKEPAHIR